MAILIVLLAFILCWIWIELTNLVLKIQNTEVTNKNNKNNIMWYLRFISLILLIMSYSYMYFFEKTKLDEVIQYCFGIIK